MKYVIIYSDYLHDLIQRVNKACLSGWEPLGAPFKADITCLEPSQWAQALIKRTPEA